MKLQEDILAEHMATPISKIIGDQAREISTPSRKKLAEKAAKIKTTEDMAKKGCKYGFLLVVLGKKSMAQ